MAAAAVDDGGGGGSTTVAVEAPRPVAAEAPQGRRRWRRWRWRWWRRRWLLDSRPRSGTPAALGGVVARLVGELGSAPP